MTQDLANKAAVVRHRYACTGLATMFAVMVSGTAALSASEVGSATVTEPELFPAPNETLVSQDLSPSEAAREEWRRLVCDGLVYTSIASEEELRTARLLPTGTLLPPSLSDDGFIEGWQERLVQAAAVVTPDEPADAAAGAGSSEAEETAPLLPKTLPWALAFILPAAGSFIYGRRRSRDAGHIRQKSGLGLGVAGRRRHTTIALVLALLGAVALLGPYPVFAGAGGDEETGDPLMDGASMDTWRAYLCDDAPGPINAAGGGIVPVDILSTIPGMEDSTPIQTEPTSQPSYGPVAFGGFSGGGGGDGGTNTVVSGNTSPGDTGGTTIVTMFDPPPTQNPPGPSDPDSPPGTFPPTGNPPGDPLPPLTNLPQAAPPPTPVPIPPALPLMLTAFAGLALGRTVSRMRRG
ncbi:MAG: hypothetical protein AAGL66_14705 [Pseudomonadota bacterium]